MLYNLSTELDRQRFQAKCTALLNKGVVVELTEKTKRTRAQNSYLHLLLGVVAMETGNSLEYVKDEYFKALVNPSIFVREVEDTFLHKKARVLRSSADLSPEEMTTAIDRFKKWGAENGIYLPSPGDESLLKAIEAEMQRMRAYL